MAARAVKRLKRIQAWPPGEADLPYWCFGANPNWVREVLHHGAGSVRSTDTWAEIHGVRPSSFSVRDSRKNP